MGREIIPAVTEKAMEPGGGAIGCTLGGNGHFPEGSTKDTHETLPAVPQERTAMAWGNRGLRRVKLWKSAADMHPLATTEHQRVRRHSTKGFKGCTFL